jgi:hypothetical protein
MPGTCGPGSGNNFCEKNFVVENLMLLTTWTWSFCSFTVLLDTLGHIEVENSVVSNLVTMQPGMFYFIKKEGR